MESRQAAAAAFSGKRSDCFQGGYLNRRINITMLYGRREAAAKQN
jgi:hypothetical protein